jgi:hypothetical protein
MAAPQSLHLDSDRCPSQHGQQVPRPLWRQRRRAILRCVLLLPLVYLASYFVLGRHTSGFDFDWSTGTGREFTYHDRDFPFDPWIYKPLARFEYWLRGRRSQVVIEDRTYRGGQPIYGYGPFE